MVRLWERFPNQLITPKTNIQMMLEVDNNNNYDYNQASGEKQMG